MPNDEPVWLVGFFTGYLHATFHPEPTLVFRGVPLTWSVCGAPVVINTHGANAPYCLTCLRTTTSGQSAMNAAFTQAHLVVQCRLVSGVVDHEALGFVAV